jgi:hypothetical protein
MRSSGSNRFAAALARQLTTVSTVFVRTFADQLEAVGTFLARRIRALSLWLWRVYRGVEDRVATTSADLVLLAWSTRLVLILLVGETCLVLLGQRWPVCWLIALIVGAFILTSMFQVARDFSLRPNVAEEEDWPNARPALASGARIVFRVLIFATGLAMTAAYLNPSVRETFVRYLRRDPRASFALVQAAVAVRPAGIATTNTSSVPPINVVIPDPARPPRIQPPVIPPAPPNPDGPPKPAATSTGTGTQTAPADPPPVSPTPTDPAPIEPSVAVGLISTASGDEKNETAVEPPDGNGSAAPDPTVPEPRYDRESRQVRVSAAVEWRASGVIVHDGDDVEISAVGSVRTAGYGVSSGPEGQRYSCDTPACLLKSQPYGSLVGRIARGPIFLIGRSSTFRSIRTGELEFAVNDQSGSYGDNSGGYKIEITVIHHGK